MRLPDYLQNLADAGLESGDQAERLTALTAANHADRRYETNYGLEVAKLFLEQMDMTLEPGAPTKRRETSWMADPQRARIIQEVSVAIGEEIGMSASFYEFVGHSATEDKNIVLRDGGIDAVHSVYHSFSFPYYFTFGFTRQWARKNFENTERAVKGLGLALPKEDGGWFPRTIKQIQGLREPDQA